MKKGTFFQINTGRFITIYVVFGIYVVFFSILAYKIIRRKKQRLNYMISVFFICTTISLCLNMVYYTITDLTAILILHFFAIFLVCFGAVFILIVNWIILESTIIYSEKKQNRYILFFGITLFIGMFIFYFLLGEESLGEGNFLGVKATESGIILAPPFFIFIILIISAFEIIPIIITSIKIYKSFETKTLKKKWFYFLVGVFGSISLLYITFINNLINYVKYLGGEEPTFNFIFSLYSMTVIIWVSLMYYGIGFKLKQ
ncbi:MAG: hypothetical protein ACFE91_15340 [Promethearchaeota archaeon]